MNKCNKRFIYDLVALPLLLNKQQSNMFLIKHKISYGFIFLISLLSIVAGDKHTDGSDAYNEILYRKQFFETNSSANTNYTVKFKYLSPQMIIELDVNCVSFLYV